ncbi:hypothetical protein SDRG_10410 [Saprolegnia diclina VS20]|uniref:Uncharacterized protein n=1 Tax=Saprolegnia diclina (strain VS20) TaxID=1156394 RepID=T0RP71_SAPDV|nr:hypothetical protein SDRG_10410 [Saprolegnia diclina VS20]EQC31892.1 hypothetical protein SDRG_10410 [Saprolegnia diclina VS20]|eukprot:XP_008614620.1 hypothetical protein SDRG_10410 [Saprolegnia diclina VS20]
MLSLIRETVTDLPLGHADDGPSNRVAAARLRAPRPALHGHAETVVGFLRTLAAALELVGFLPLRDVWPALHVRAWMLPHTLERVMGALPLYDTVHVYSRHHMHGHMQAFDARYLAGAQPLETATAFNVGLECQHVNDNDA